MALYKNTLSKLDSIKENPFKLEREIQRLFETNLSLIMGLEIVKSEFSIKNKRIDTLGFDPQSKAFVIIEYKRDRNSSVVDQGFTYLNLMLQNKADFILEYNEGLKKSIKRDEVDWSQTRVAFVSPGFTENQREATNFKDIAIELWEVKQFENGIISINQIKKSNAAESIKAITDQNKELQEISKEIKVYTEDDHLQGKPDETIELYEKFKAAILDLSPDLEVKPQKFYIAFKRGSNVCDIEIQKNTIKISVNLKAGKLDDPKNLMRDVSVLKGHSLNGDYELRVDSDKDLEYIMSLVKQAINP
jgi:predicted transport protein